jgi:hypothetical protein
MIDNMPVLIFLHIPKTAGTTLNILLENHFNPAESYSTFPTRMHPSGSLEGYKKLPQEKIAGLKMVTGHMGFGLHERFSRPVTYVTLLRHPIKRVVSHYLHEKRDPTSPTHHIIKAGHMDLKEFARYYAEAEMDNLQTRMVAGNWERRGHGPCDGAMLDQAKANLAERFSVVGLSKAFNTFYLLLCRKMGWRPRFYVRHNQNQGQTANAASALDGETRAKIESYNQFDFALYEYGELLLNELVSAQDKGFAWQLHRYHLLNKVYQWYWAGRRVSVRTWLASTSAARAK